LKNRPTYNGFWNLDFLQIKVIYPVKSGECTKSNFPDCNAITIINKTGLSGIPSSAYVSLCRHEFKDDNYFICELGMISASGKGLQNSGGSNG